MTRRKLLLLLMTLVSIPSTLFGLGYWFWRPTCRVTRCIITLPREDELAIVLSDPEQIESLVLQPIRSAKLDTTRAGWRVFGDLLIQYENGTVEDYWLFIPLGYFLRHRDGCHLVTDFGALSAELRKRIMALPGMNRVRQLLEYE